MFHIVINVTNILFKNFLLDSPQIRTRVQCTLLLIITSITILNMQKNVLVYATSLSLY